MKVVGRERLFDFCAKHADARSWIENWLAEVEGAKWALPQNVKDRYASVSFLAGNVVIFNVRGNEYRLEVKIAYQTSVVIVIWVGTHKEYDLRNSKR